MNGGLILKKQEMTRLWVDGKFMAATLLKVVDQHIVGFRTMEKDGYEAVIVGADKKELNKDKGIKVKYGMMCEFDANADFISNNEAGKTLDMNNFENVENICIVGISKGKGFQGVVRRYHFAGGPETHGSKFHRRPGSVGNRKPRRVTKGTKLPGHMGLETVKLKNIKILDRLNIDNEQFVAVKGSVPGAYNSYVKVIL